MKKTIIIIICLIALFGIANNSQAIELLIKDYPIMGGETLTGESTFPEIIRYIYLFALGIVGFIALLSMTIGAIQYVTSAGSPDKAADAKNRIFQSLLGILILLASVLILNIINPDLIKLGITLPEIPNMPQGDACECTQQVNSLTDISDGITNTQQWCQNHVQENCPSGTVFCNVINVYQGSSGVWRCRWKAVWSADFGPISCDKCSVDSETCSNYFNNILRKPCFSPGTTCSAKCI